MSKDSRHGGKYTKAHSTLSPAASRVCDIAEKCDLVKKIAIGVLSAGLKPVSGKRRVKLTPENRYCILVKIRDSASCQEVRIFTDKMQETIVAMSDGCSKIGFEVVATLPLRE